MRLAIVLAVCAVSFVAVHAVTAAEQAPQQLQQPAADVKRLYDITRKDDQPPGLLPQAPPVQMKREQPRPAPFTDKILYWDSSEGGARVQDLRRDPIAR